MPEASAKFLTGNLFRHIAVMSFTASLGLMAIFLVDLIDMIFISMLGQAELAAAVGYAGAILFFTTSFALGMGIATGALVSQALGAGDIARANRLKASSLGIGFALGVVFVFLIWPFLEVFVGLLGATGETKTHATLYLSIIVPSLPLLMLGIIGGAILRAHGDARRAMMSTIAGGAANAVLDPILIFGLNLDLAGAAMASVAARVVIAGVALSPVLRLHGGIARPELPDFLKDFIPIFKIAIPAILTSLATPVGQAFVTREMAGFGEGAIAGMAIVGRLTPVAFAAVLALSGAIGPIFGQNFGAGKKDRVQETLRDGLLFIVAVVVAMTALLYFLREPLADIFNAQGDALTLLYLFCGPLALLYIFNGALLAANACFNNLGHPFYSTWMNWGRHTIGTIPFVLVGAAFWGAPGILVGQLLGGALFGIAAITLASRVIAGGEYGPGNEVSQFHSEGRMMHLCANRK